MSKESVWMFSPECPPYFKGGLGTHLFELSLGLAELGHSVALFAPHERNHSIRLDDRAVAHFCAPLDSIMRGGVAGSIAKIKGVLKTARDRLRSGVRPKFVHCHEWFLFPAAAEIARCCGCPLIATLHVSQAVVHHWGAAPVKVAMQAEEQICEHASTLITVSADMKAELARFYNSNPARARVVHNGCAEIAPLLAQQSSGPVWEPVDRFRHSVLFAGRFVAQKGLMELVRSAEIVCRHRDDVAYLFFGAESEDDLKPWRERFATEEALRGRLFFGKTLDRWPLHRLRQTATLVVVPSRYEPFGYSALEAMLAGTCVLGSSSGGIKEFLSDEENGFLLPVTEVDGATQVSVEDLTSLQLRLLDDPELVARIGRQAKSSVTDRFSRRKMAEGTWAEYTRSPVYRGPDARSLIEELVPGN